MADGAIEYGNLKPGMEVAIDLFALWKNRTGSLFDTIISESDFWHHNYEQSEHQLYSGFMMKTGYDDDAFCCIGAPYYLTIEVVNTRTGKQCYFMGPDGCWGSDIVKHVDDRASSMTRVQASATTRKSLSVK